MSGGIKKKKLVKSIFSRIFSKNDLMPREKILNLLDKSYKEAEFPYLDTFSHWAYGKIRCSLFQSAEEWLIIMDMLAFYPNQGNFNNTIYAYGNSLKKNGFQDYKGKQKSGQDYDNFVNRYSIRVPDINEDWMPIPLNFSVRLNGKITNYILSESEYRKHGIDIYENLSGDQVYDQIIFILRYLVKNINPEELFFPDDILFTYLGRDKKLELVLRLDDWVHPGIQGIDLPSQSKSFQNMIDVIINNDPDLFIFSGGNTDWENWKEFLDP